MRLLSFERRWFATIFAAILPSNAHPTLTEGADTLPMGRYADELVQRAPARVAFGFRGAALLIVLFGAALAGRWKPFLWLTQPQQAQVLDAMTHHNLYLVRELPTLMKVLATMGYAGAPHIQQQLGVVRVDETPPSWMQT